MVVLPPSLLAIHGGNKNIRNELNSGFFKKLLVFMHSGVVARVQYVCRVQSTHGLLGIPGYVQFTSHIRRYVNLLAHYQRAIGWQVI
ncbi:uncharacterized protein LOC119342695 isoform X2 [Triticum dicoccoides]|uniref:uncharacterized protein LOC119342695 isoform X2 n=1 Tax=Triticum dicoccoides TaxID=85692 RepID=UPI00189054B5|nr:uncharacterized protein LOC119342695 isoform X2 [Triticum dicoccoides]